MTLTGRVEDEEYLVVEDEQEPWDGLNAHRVYLTVVLPCHVLAQRAVVQHHNRLVESVAAPPVIAEIKATMGTGLYWGVLAGTSALYFIGGHTLVSYILRMDLLIYFFCLLSCIMQTIQSHC